MSKDRPETHEFKVGDRVKQRYSSWPEATITELTERGFKYVYDKPFMISPRMGSATGGECYETGLEGWEVVAPAPRPEVAGGEAPPEPPEPELELCAHCGSKGVFELDNSDPDITDDWWYVDCSLCPIKTYPQTTKAEAARIWNTRVRADTAETPPAALGLIDQAIAVKDAVKIIKEFACSDWEVLAGRVAKALLIMPTAPPAVPEAGEAEGGCPCLYTTPCDPDCTCVHPHSSRGCMRCCTYGSLEQRTANAKRLAAVPSPDAERVAGLDEAIRILRDREGWDWAWMECCGGSAVDPVRSLTNIIAALTALRDGKKGHNA